MPLRAARSLAVQRHEAHGLVLPDLAGPFYGDLLMGYERWAGEHGQSVVITVTHGNPDPRRSRARSGRAGRRDRCPRQRYGPDDGPGTAARPNVPVVLIAHPPVTGCDSVRSESAASAERLTDAGCSTTGAANLLFVGDPASSYDVSERYAGFAEAHELRGLTVPKPDRVAADRGGRAARSPKRCSQASTQPARRAGLRERRACAGRADQRCSRPGVDVPGDVVVTGWDDVMAARYVSPGLTTVRQPMTELGRLAAQRLHERVTGERSRARNDVLATQLVLRASCGTTRGMHDAVTE